jgi:serine/threonine protein kinase
LKIIPSDCEREISNLKLISRSDFHHPGIIRVYRIISDNFNTILELESAITDMERVIKNFYNTISDIKEYIRESLQAIAFLHKKGYAHCDIKPSNILITEKKKIKLSDFATLSPINTPADIRLLTTSWFCSPESFICDSIDLGPADIWAIGVTMGCLIKGEYIIRGDTISDLFKNVGNIHRIDYSSIGDDGVDLLFKLIEVDPKKRITAEEALKHNFFR